MFNFGFTDVIQVGDAGGGIFLVQLACGCTAVVGGGRILRWPGSVAAVCEHVRS